MEPLLDLSDSHAPAAEGLGYSLVCTTCNWCVFIFLRAARFLDCLSILSLPELSTLLPDRKAFDSTSARVVTTPKDEPGYFSSGTTWVVQDVPLSLLSLSAFQGFLPSSLSVKERI